MIPGWLNPYLKHLSVTDPREIREILKSKQITFMGERLKVEIALLERLHLHNLKETGKCLDSRGKKKLKTFNDGLRP